MSTHIESFWGNILSNDPVKILKAIHSLSVEEQQAMIDHLQRMASETGWSEGQKRGARTALDVLRK